MAKRTKDTGGTLSLFPDDTAPGKAEYAEKNRGRLRAWSRRGILLGTSSWKYSGWKGQVYTRPYPSQRVFEKECLAEYATLFPTVCADFALYDFPAPDAMARINDQTPEDFKLALKVTDRITIWRYPNIPRYGSSAGMNNPDFLNADLFEEAFLRPLDVLHGKRGTIIFEFSMFHPSSGVTTGSFVQLLDGFLAKLPKGYLYAVEVRNADFLTGEYLAMLRAHGVAHVINSWTRMPPVIQQIQVAGVLTAGYSVIRALLKPGRTYEEAVQSFTPYDRIREENPELREGIVEAIRRCVADGRTLYAYFNNRAEGNSPKTIEAILDVLDRYPEEKL
jgi:uncharacterized protein YecE (DUF72 family)